MRDYFVRGFDSGLGAYEIGKTKVFIGSQALFALESLRTAKLPSIACIMQRSIRKCLFRMKMTRFYELHQSMIDTTEEYLGHGRRARRHGRRATAGIEALRHAAGHDAQPNSFGQRVDARKTDMHASFVQGTHVP